MLVLQMKPMENVCVDQTRLDALYTQLGEADAEEILCRALEDIALRLSHCSELYHSQDMPELRRNTRMLIAVGDQIGMLAVTRVATDVVACIDRGDTIAIAATLSRLLRVGERSLCAVWNSDESPI